MRNVTHVADASRPGTRIWPASWTRLRRSWTTWRRCCRRLCCSCWLAAGELLRRGRRCRRVETGSEAYTHIRYAAHAACSGGICLDVRRAAGQSRVSRAHRITRRDAEHPPSKGKPAELLLADFFGTSMCKSFQHSGLTLCRVFAESGTRRGICCADCDAAAAGPADACIHWRASCSGWRPAAAAAPRAPVTLLMLDIFDLG